MHGQMSGALPLATCAETGSMSSGPATVLAPRAGSKWELPTSFHVCNMLFEPGR